MKGFPLTQKLRLLAMLELALIVGLACVPLFITFPYRVNIFLSWEGAYRLSQGHVPYRDFGMPMGYMYWVIPALFFKVFGAQLITLVKAQVLINIMSGLAFRSILKSLQVQPGIRFLSVVLYITSYSFFNFWPWYNHTVIVYELVGLAFLMRYIFAVRKHWILLPLAALFLFFSFFTKQDGGGLAIILCTVLLGAHCFYERSWKPMLIYIGSLVIVGFALVMPLARFHFGYWFNHGQPPHTARFSPFEIVEEFFSGSQWIKFYLLMTVLVALAYYRNWRKGVADKQAVIFLLLTLGILAEAAVLQVTSYTPPDNNIFFHSFAFVFLLSFLARLLPLDFSKPGLLAVGLVGVLLWWSGSYWKYMGGLVQRFRPVAGNVSPTGENIVNRSTYMIFRDTTEIPMDQWTTTGLHAFNRIKLPQPTVDGIHRLLNLDLVKQHPGSLRVLNMSELTPLAVEMPYALERGPDVPLWYHLGVAMFNKEAETYEQKIAQGQYDLVLFEYIPSLNNFYPFRVRDSLQRHYQKIDSFFAPRRGDTKGTIEVYVKP
jgi:hypothetical protein